MSSETKCHRKTSLGTQGALTSHCHQWSLGRSARPPRSLTVLQLGSSVCGCSGCVVTSADAVGLVVRIISRRRLSSFLFLFMYGTGSSWYSSPPALDLLVDKALLSGDRPLSGVNWYSYFIFRNRINFHLLFGYIILSHVGKWIVDH